ncbi:Uncharacterized protein FWK35_00016979 [Aphis craccivora]|uniref:Uncharacterized protein n=1 Tax=Aphis craccivora TaxID=307492 RepID=A0A6G0Y4X2_APHCR|nr:Uncharacterized protein FWK35_00016979 [Aphis craccivora]
MHTINKKTEATPFNVEETIHYQEIIIFQFIENDGQNNCSLQDKLSQLIAKYHISHKCVNEMLVILRSEGLDVRSLLKTSKSKSHNIIQMDNGSWGFFMEELKNLVHCNACLEEGEFINRRMSFLGIDSQLRTNE